jgi:hypothetical protein
LEGFFRNPYPARVQLKKWSNRIIDAEALIAALEERKESLET